jgi:hypothetical protein
LEIVLLIEEKLWSILEITHADSANLDVYSLIMQYSDWWDIQLSEECTIADIDVR